MIIKFVIHIYIIFVADIRDKRRKFLVESGPCFQNINIFVAYIKTVDLQNIKKFLAMLYFQIGSVCHLLPLHGF